MEITREFLIENGRLTRQLINHEEYIYNGKLYIAGWTSNHKWGGPCWLVYGSPTKPKMEIIRGNVKVEWVELGEGCYGDYDEDDPYDVELLRFDVSILINDEWIDPGDASYCTRFPVAVPDWQKFAGLLLIMSEVYEPASEGNSIKKLCERLSWISPDWLEDKDKEDVMEDC
jgi:hypothetical protein